MRRIAIINQKGGVGKTTTTVNLGCALARAGHRVLMIDLDPQAHLSLHLGFDPSEAYQGTYEMLTGSATLDQARRQVADNLWVVGSSIDLAAAEVELVGVVGREVILDDLIKQHVGTGAHQYDFLLMDCPPSLGTLTLNGLCAASEVFIPLQPHYLALQGLSKLLDTVSLVTRRINKGLVVSGIVVCMHDSGTKLCGEVVDNVYQFLKDSRNTDVPWAGAQMFDTFIRRNIKLAEAPSHGQSIFDYAPDSNGAKDYARLSGDVDGSGRAELPSIESSVIEELDPAMTETIRPKPLDDDMRKRATASTQPDDRNTVLPRDVASPLNQLAAAHHDS